MEDLKKWLEIEYLTKKRNERKSLANRCRRKTTKKYRLSLKAVKKNPKIHPKRQRKFRADASALEKRNLQRAIQHHDTNVLYYDSDLLCQCGTPHWDILHNYFGGYTGALSSAARSPITWRVLAKKMWWCWKKRRSLKGRHGTPRGLSGSFARAGTPRGC